MKLTLWQQFSSNHSSSFTVVGRCSSIEKAIEVEQILKKLFADIVENNRFLPPRLLKENDGPTWPEVEAAEKYNIEWTQGFDWIVEPEQQVVRMAQYVFATTHGIGVDTYQRPDTLEQLMSRLADEMYVARYETYPRDSIIFTEIHATAPDEKIADDIVTEVGLYLNPAVVDGAIPPWEMYYERDYFYLENFIQTPTTKTDSTVIRAVIQALYDCQRAGMEKRPTHGAETAAFKALNALREYGYTFKLELTRELLWKIVAKTGENAMTDTLGGLIKRSGTQIHIPKIWLWIIYEGLPVIIDYLKAKGCTDIRYAFKTVPYNSPNPIYNT